MATYGLSRLEVGNHLNWRLQITNLGNQPAKILTAEVRTAVGPLKNGYPEASINGVLEKRTKLDRYVSKESPYTFENETDFVLDSNTVSKIFSGYSAIWIKGIFRYQNLVSKKVQVYELIIRLVPPFEIAGYETLLNENYDEK